MLLCLALEIQKIKNIEPNLNFKELQKYMNLGKNCLFFSI
jgi:hypothetical protein